MPLNGRDRNAEERSRFFGAEPDEKAQFDQIGFERVLSFQRVIVGPRVSFAENGFGRNWARIEADGAIVGLKKWFMPIG